MPGLGHRSREGPLKRAGRVSQKSSLLKIHFSGVIEAAGWGASSPTWSWASGEAGLCWASFSTAVLAQGKWQHFFQPLGSVCSTVTCELFLCVDKEGPCEAWPVEPRAVSKQPSVNGLSNELSPRLANGPDQGQAQSQEGVVGQVVAPHFHSWPRLQAPWLHRDHLLHPPGGHWKEDGGSWEEPPPPEGPALRGQGWEKPGLSVPSTDPRSSSRPGPFPVGHLGPSPKLIPAFPLL